MNLRGRAHLVVSMALVIVVVLCGVFLFVRLKAAQVEHEIVLVDTLIIDSAQLRTVIFDYLLRRETRPRLQAKAKLGDLHTLLEDQARLIADDPLQDEQAKVLWENVRRLLAECESLFAGLVGQEADPTLRERDRRTADLLLLSSQSLVLSFGQIHRMAISKLLKAHYYEEMTLWTLLASLAGLGMILFLLLWKGVLAPLQQLHEAAIRIAAGQQDLRLRSSRRDEFGQLAYVLDHMLDQLATVSRDRLEAEMRARDIRFEATFEQAAVGIAHVGPDGRWLRVNRKLCEIVGYNREELLARTFQDITYPDDLDIDLAYVRQMLAGEIDTYSMEKRYRRKDGSLVWINLTVALVWKADGAPDYFITVVEDIQRRKQAEDEIRRLNAELEERVRQRTAELTAANQELDSFAYAVSHDLRAPLRAMSGFSQALLEDYGERLDGEARIYLDQIIMASHHMSELIDGILTLSRSTRGELRRDPVDLATLAERLLAEYAAAEPERQVVWRVEPGLRVRGDPVMLEVVMRNLIENAWKYTAKTPNATIRVYSEDEEGKRCFCVADNGAGFDMTHANRLFKAFQRLHRQDEFPGIGIGLATVQRIIHRHGGAIRAEGAPGRGATFRFTLPDAETPGKELDPLSRR